MIPKTHIPPNGLSISQEIYDAYLSNLNPIERGRYFGQSEAVQAAQLLTWIELKEQLEEVL